MGAEGQPGGADTETATPALSATPAAAPPLQTGQRPAAAPAVGSAATWGNRDLPRPFQHREPFGSVCGVRTERTPILPTGTGSVEGALLPALHDTARYGMAQHGTALCCIALHCTALHCAAALPSGEERSGEVQWLRAMP